MNKIYLVNIYNEMNLNNESEYSTLRKIISNRELAKQSNINLKCLSCGGNDLIIDNVTNEKICNDCGSVNESNNYDMLTSYEEAQTTTISDTSSINITIKGLTNWHIRRFYEWHFIMPYKERSINEIFKFIQQKCKELNLSVYVSDDAKILYKIIINNYTDKNLNKVVVPKKIVTRGNNKLGIIGACIFYACKKTGYLRTIRDISQILKIKSSFVNNGCKIFSKCIRQLNIKINVNLSYPTQYLKSLTVLLDLNDKQVEDINKILMRIEDNNLVSNHTPYSIAMSTVIIYLEENGISVSKKDIAEKSSISLVTINKTIKTLLSIKDIIFGNHNIIDNKSKNLTDEDIKYLNKQKIFFEQINLKDYENLQIDLNKLFI